LTACRCDWCSPKPQPELCAFFVDVGLAFGLDTWAHQDKHIAFRPGVVEQMPQPWPPVLEVLPSGGTAPHVCDPVRVLDDAIAPCRGCS
jgi:hypothetical protein